MNTIPTAIFSVLCLVFTVAFTTPAGSVIAPLPTTPAPAAAPDSSDVDLSGTWVGKLLQNPGGVAPEFDFTMELKHNGPFVKGTSFVRYDRIWVEMTFSGHRTENGNIEIVETEILRSQKPDDLAWCMKEYKLRAEFTKEGLILIGPWWGNSVYGPCIPGSVRLVRKIKTA